MTVYPDGDALSYWEWNILEEIEHDMEESDPLLAAFFSRDDPESSRVLAANLVANLVAAETVLALTALTAMTACVAGTMMALAAIGTSLWRVPSTF